jgi:hypothetical protein
MAEIQHVGCDRFKLSFRSVDYQVVSVSPVDQLQKRGGLGDMHAVRKPDRRAPSRPLDPSTCPDCHAIATPAVLRTDVAVYFHCAWCGRLWSIQKPAKVADVSEPQS